MLTANMPERFNGELKRRRYFPIAHVWRADTIYEQGALNSTIMSAEKKTSTVKYRLKKFYPQRKENSQDCIE